VILLIGMVMKKNIYLSKKFIGIAIFFAKLIGYLFAYTFGRISPNKRIKKAIRPIIIIKFKKSGAELKYINFPNEANIKTIEILIKLFEIKRVERSLLGLFLNFKTNRSFLFFDSEIFFMSFSYKEKKATSKPEIRAEQINSIKTIENLKISG
jgi:hypothetical protein